MIERPSFSEGLFKKATSWNWGVGVRKVRETKKEKKRENEAERGD